METLPLIDGTTETQEDTEPMMAKLAALLAQDDERSQDHLSTAITHLERAYRTESSDLIQSNIKRALELLRSGSTTEDDEDE